MRQVGYLRGLYLSYLLVYLNPIGIPCLNNNQEYFPSGNGGRCVGLTTLPPSYACFLEILEPETVGTLTVCPEFYRDSLTLTFTLLFFVQCHHMSLWTSWSSILGMAEV